MPVEGHRSQVRMREEAAVEQEALDNQMAEELDTQGQEGLGNQAQEILDS